MCYNINIVYLITVGTSKLFETAKRTYFEFLYYNGFFYSSVLILIFSVTYTIEIPFALKTF